MVGRVWEAILCWQSVRGGLLCSVESVIASWCLTRHAVVGGGCYVGNQGPFREYLVEAAGGEWWISTKAVCSLHKEFS